jgi:hypothetical protein
LRHCATKQKVARTILDGVAGIIFMLLITLRFLGIKTCEPTEELGG